MLDTVANVVPMPSRQKTARVKAPRKSPSGARRLKRQVTWGLVVVGVIVVALVLSLSHLAHGIAMITKAPTWESWALAILVDCGFLAFEVGQLAAANPSVRKEVTRFTKPGIIGSLIFSAIMNALAFSAQAETLLFQVFGASFGLGIPAAMYLLTREAFVLLVRK